MMISLPVTELQNPHTADLDQLPTLAMLERINQEDQKVALAVKKALPQIAEVVDAIHHALANDHSLYYIGAGTSGRLGVLDAAECPATFSTASSLVQAIIAGGETALRFPIEGAEDDGDLGIRNVRQYGVSRGDVLVGISASGNPAYVVEALRHAKEEGVITVSLTCNPHAQANEIADFSIVTEVGPEVLSGSSRLKAGSAQKMVLNMLTTASMVKLGKTYGNLMVDLKASNEKLKIRAVSLVMQIAKVDKEAAQHALDRCNGQVKLAVLLALNIAGNPKEAQCHLDAHKGRLRACLE
ncbi:MAG: N-acetylmuramic acid 6-phosphate etherase [Vampirovibrionales bacterium]